jgi:hypothetical protein
VVEARALLLVTGSVQRLRRPEFEPPLLLLPCLLVSQPEIIVDIFVSCPCKIICRFRVHGGSEVKAEGAVLSERVRYFQATSYRSSRVPVVRPSLLVLVALNALINFSSATTVVAALLGRLSRRAELLHQ